MVARRHQQAPGEEDGEDRGRGRQEQRDEHDVARAERHEVPLGAIGVGAEGAGVHREGDALGVADGAGHERHDVAEPARDRRERSAAAVGAAHPVRLADDLELVPEARHEAERRERRVADAVRHPQLLHRCPHDVGPGRREPGDERERDDRREPQAGREADRERAAVERPRSRSAR